MNTSQLNPPERRRLRAAYEAVKLAEDNRHVANPADYGGPDLPTARRIIFTLTEHWPCDEHPRRTATHYERGATSESSKLLCPPCAAVAGLRTVFITLRLVTENPTIFGRESP